MRQLLLLLLFCGQFAPANSASLCNTQEQLEVSNTPRLLTLPQGNTVLAERGAELEYSQDGANWTPLAMPGTRLGWHLFQNTRTVWIKSSLVPSASLSMHKNCGFSPAQIAWLNRLQHLAEAHDFTVTAQSATATEIQALVDTATDEFQQALVSHVYANQAFLGNEPEQAAGYFRTSRLLWRKLGWESYEIAAALGENSMISRIDGFIMARQIAETYVNYGDDRIEFRYFRNRLREELCQDPLIAGNFEQVGKCLSPVLYEYLELGESGDYLNTLTKVAYAMSLEERLNAIHSGIFVDALARTPKIPALRMSRGRFYLMAADAVRTGGDFASALNYLKSAQLEFQNATEESASWLVFIDLLASDIHSQFGLDDQAMVGIQNALKRLDAKSQPARAASIFVQLGENFRRMGMRDQARRWLKISKKINTAMGQELRVKFANLALLELEERPSSAAVDALALPEIYAARVQLLRARALRAAGQSALARDTAEQAFLLAGTPSGRADAAVFRSELSESDRQAEQVLHDYLSENALRADQSNHATLAFLNIRSGDRARRAWVDRLSLHSDAERVFQTALMSNPSRFMTPNRTQSAHFTAPVKLAEDAMGFLAQITASTSAKNVARISALTVPSVSAIQAQIPLGGKVLVLVPGARQSAALWIAPNRIDLKLLPPRSSLHQIIQALNASLSSPTTKRLEFMQAQRQLSEALFTGMAGDTVPSTLWIIADELSSAIPFSSLYWPNSESPLLLSTDVSYITGLLASNSAQPAGDVTKAFFAPSYESKNALDFAKVEFERIRSALGEVPAAYIGATANRRQFRQLLQTPGAWIHVSAHGHADTGILGNAGLWLSRETEPEPEFLSWLELSDLRARAQLLVLNACQSARSAQSTRQANISFASAMSMSGVRHVLAALWPVSDVAAATWIPVFYRNLPGRDSDASAAALRSAQLSLYHAPHYQHPFYWASLVHFRRIDFIAQNDQPMAR